MDILPIYGYITDQWINYRSMDIIPINGYTADLWILPINGYTTVYKCTICTLYGNLYFMRKKVPDLSLRIPVCLRTVSSPVAPAPSIP